MYLRQWKNSYSCSICCLVYVLFVSFSMRKKKGIISSQSCSSEPKLNNIWKFSNRLVDRTCSQCPGPKMGMSTSVRITKDVSYNSNGGCLLERSNLFRKLTGSLLRILSFRLSLCQKFCPRPDEIDWGNI